MKRSLKYYILLFLIVTATAKLKSQNFYLDDLKGGNVFLLSSFRMGHSELTDEHKVTLEKLVFGFETYPSLQIEVLGHTDFAGNAEANMMLSKDRVNSVRDYLISRGVNNNKIKASFFGGKYPISKERSKEVVQLNRRVEILITTNYELGVSNHSKERLSYLSSNNLKDSISKPVTSGRRIALLIGNSKYKHSAPLRNPGNDVKLMELTLKNLGFEVSTKYNLDFTGLRKELQSFARKLSSNDVVFFYFAGHGMQYKGNNYILPIDAQLESGAKDLEFESISVEIIFKILEYSNKESLNIIVLDACRNNNFPSKSRSGNVGLASIAPPSGTVIGFSTSPGSVAFDGDGDNGIYTKELAIQLSKSQRIEDVFMNTRNQVEEVTNMAQSPWELFRLREVYSLK